MHTTMASFAQDTPHHRSNPNSRRASAATTRSSRSMRDRRRSSGALSSHSQSQKPKKCIGDYVVGKTLGKGASGRVKLGVHRYTGEQVAIKIISKAHLAANPAIEKAVRREIAIMKLIHHPNVMSLIDVIDDPASSDLHLILEYVQGGELFEYLVSKGRLSEAEARHHFQQIILGLDYCHHHLICHRDLKPENLLLNSRNSIKIADFGMASLQPLGSMLETSCGSPHYASPEIVAGMPYNGSACDIWSCGVILYALLTGHLPFDDENIRQLLKKVKSGKYMMPDNISRSAQDLIRRILVVDPARRLNMQQIMAHPWFRESEPQNISVLPIPPTEKEIGQPVNDASEIDDRILETIKFLWGESSNEAVINALIQKEHNMQKVVYVLLQQHAERYWQADHDEDESDNEEVDQRYRTMGHNRTESRCLSMVVDNASTISTASAPAGVGGRRSSAAAIRVAPWMPPPPKDILRRYSAATIRAATPPVFLDELPASPLPLRDTAEQPKMKKSDTFYARFVKNVLSSSSRRQPKDNRKNTFDTGITPQPTTKAATTTLVGTLRRKNPFHRAPINTTDFAISSVDQPSRDITSPTSPAVPPKSTLRPTSHILHNNKIDPDEPESEIIDTSSPRKSNKSATLRMSLRLPNAFTRNSNKDGGETEGTVSSKKFGFTLGSNARKQRKQLDLTLFQSTEQPDTTQSSIQFSTNSDSDILDDKLIPPAPILSSDGSTLSCSSSSSSSSYSNKKPAVVAAAPRRSSQASFKSIDRRASNTTLHRPTTPSLLSNSSTIPTQPSNKASWLNNLFFFKQPKVCSLVVYSTHTAGILRSLHRLMNKTAEVRFYEKCDRVGVTRYKAEIKTKGGSEKVRQVKCRIELIMSDLDPQSCVVQFTQQQGDGVLLNSTIQQLHQAILKEYPCPSNIIIAAESFNKEMNSVMTSGTLVEQDV